jgi:hypothetical protein
MTRQDVVVVGGGHWVNDAEAIAAEIAKRATGVREPAGAVRSIV